MTPISTAPALTRRTPPSAISSSRHTNTSAMVPSLVRLACFLAPRVELGNREILPARHVGHLGEGLAERPGGIDADAGGGAQRPRFGRFVDRRVGRARRNL